MINIEFRWMRNAANKDCDLFLKKVKTCQAPTVGELVNIDGDPFIVTGRSWAYGTTKSVWCYIRVVKATNTKYDVEKYVPEPVERQDAHTEHCCKLHGCKYGDEEKCPVVNRSKRQSGPCEECK